MTPEKQAWRNMRKRCKGHDRMGEHYKGRNITVCDEWADDFDAFLSHVGPRPSPKHTLDRIDNDKGYFPGNVQWATRKEQARNRSSNVVLEHNGLSLTLIEWCEIKGMKHQTMRNRIKAGWSVRKILETPLRKSA